MKLLFRLRALLRRRSVEAEMAEEMRLHLEQRVAENVESGMSPEDARFAAERRFGGIEQFKEVARAQRPGMWWDRTIQDVGFAVRQLRRSPAFASVTIIMLALGIGACSAMFTVVNSVLLRPIRIPDSDRLVIVQETHPRYSLVAVSPANFRMWEANADAFESMAVRSGYDASLVGEGEPVRVHVAGVTGQYFQMLGLQPLLGRVFGEPEQKPDSSAVVVLTHRFWQRQFGGRADIVGRSLNLGAQVCTVLGVLPRDFDAGSDDVFMPIGMPEEMWQTRGRFFSWVVGRLKSEVTLEYAQTQMNTLAERQADAFPQWNKDWSIRVTSLLDFETKAVRNTLYALLAAVMLLLVIVCVTVANLAFVRATVRQPEISIRAALGASRARILRQLITESLVLAIVGGILGFLIAQAGIHALLTLAPFELPRASEIALDARPASFAFAVTLCTGIAFGLLPGWTCTRPELLKVGRGVSHSPGAGRIRQLLVVAQIALTLMLLIGAGLLIRSVEQLSTASPGFRPENVLILKVQSPSREAAEQVRFAETLTGRFQGLTGVDAAAATYEIPFSGVSSPFLLEVEGHETPFNTRPGIIHYPITPNYFQAMGIPLLYGRAFTNDDRAGTLPVVVISRTLAERFFPGEDPIGRRIRWDSRNAQVWREIVGVVDDVRHDGYDKDIVPQVYVPFTQHSSAIVTFVVRAERDLAALAPELRRELHAIAPDVPVTRLDSLQQIVGASFARHRFAMSLFVVFAVVALLLSAAGIYGVIAYGVAQRTREFGIRMALGAQRSELGALVFARGTRLAAAGLVIGLAGGWMTSRLVQSLLFQVTRHDPLVIASVTALLAVTACAACWLPARRAAKVDPMVALRCE